jgi:hypothetical protein
MLFWTWRKIDNRKGLFHRDLEKILNTYDMRIVDTRKEDPRHARHDRCDDD